MDNRPRDGSDSVAGPLSRRSYLKLAGSAVALSSVAAKPAVAGTTDGYGYGGYGNDGYGTESGVAVTTDEATGVGETTATLNGSLTDLGGASSVDVYFEYRETTVTSWSTTAAQTLSETGSFSRSLSGLDDGVDYELRAVASASNGDTDTGTAVSFTTTEQLVAVTTGDPTNLDETTATLNGSLTDLGNASSADVYFQYRLAGGDSWTRTPARTLSSTGSFDESVADLLDGEDYEYRAFAVASDDDTDSGDVTNFSTVEHLVAVSTDAATDVGDTKATLNGSVTDLGNAAETDVYFEYREVGLSSWTVTSTQSLSDAGSFSDSVSGLSSGTDYEYRAVAEASDGDSDTGGLVTCTTTAADHAPAIEEFTVSESGSPNPHANISVDWLVSDEDGDLDTVTVTVADESGHTVESAETAVSGGRASGSESFKIKQGGGQDYEVTLAVRDASGNDTTRRTLVSS